ncbi:class C sortase [Microbacterium sp. 1P10UB]|uniref:class C sortase n=1 Tax=unclassified Microbacterium TaxID=2609290 RepID=UPI0039A3C54C
MAGAGLLIYPSAAAWFSQLEQSQRIGELSDEIVDLGAQTLRERLAEAREYNSDLSGAGAAVAANERLPLADDPDQRGTYDYSTVLRGDSEGLMARLKIPAIQADLPIYHGTGTDVLEHGVGHLEGTALPVGGASTHSVLTAHRGLATAELFTHLDRVQVGDTFTIEVFGEVLVYAVTDTRVVDPADTESLQPVTGKDLVTLVTCTPLGVNSHRILVTGERVIPTPAEDLADAGKRPEIPTFPWWIVWIAGVLAVVTVYIWLSGRPPRAIRRATASVPAASPADGATPAPDDGEQPRPDSAPDGPRPGGAQPPG